MVPTSLQHRYRHVATSVDVDGMFVWRCRHRYRCEYTSGDVARCCRRCVYTDFNIAIDMYRHRAMSLAMFIHRCQHRYRCKQTSCDVAISIYRCRNSGVDIAIDVTRHRPMSLNRHVAKVVNHISIPRSVKNPLCRGWSCDVGGENKCLFEK